MGVKNSRFNSNKIFSQYLLDLLFFLDLWNSGELCCSHQLLHLVNITSDPKLSSPTSLHAISDLTWCTIYPLQVSTRHVTSQSYVVLALFLKAWRSYCSLNNILLISCWQLALKVTCSFHCCLSPDTLNHTHSQPSECQDWAPTGRPSSCIFPMNYLSSIFLLKFPSFGNLVNKIPYSFTLVGAYDFMCILL